jgi:hypothetical protein
LACAKKASEVAHEQLVKQAIILIGRSEGMREAPLVRLAQQLLLMLVYQKLHLEVVHRRSPSRHQYPLYLPGRYTNVGVTRKELIRLLPKLVAGRVR